MAKKQIGSGKLYNKQGLQINSVVKNTTNSRQDYLHIFKQLARYKQIVTTIKTLGFTGLDK